MGIETAALVAAGAGGLFNAGTNWWNQQQTNQQNAANRSLIQQNLPQMDQAGQAENRLLSFLGQMPEWSDVTPGEGFNIGQDALSQMLRAMPESAAHTNLESLVETGDPFDTSELFKTLGKLDERHRTEALGDLRAGAGGLGQRFGSAMMRNEGETISRMVEDAAARNAGIGMQSHEAAQGRRLQAAGQLGQREQQMAAIGQMLAQLGLAEGGLGIQNQQGQQGQQMQMLQGLSQLLGAEGRRGGQQAQLLSLLLGIPATQAYNTGQDFSDFGQLMMLLQHMDN